MRARRKKWVTPFFESHPELRLENFQADDPFFQTSPLYLEIGFGKGDFLLGLSAIQAGHYLGIERDEQVVGIAYKKLMENGSESIRMFCGDVDFAFEKFQNLRFDKIYLNFSDPWPKLRHAKRRLTFAPRLERIVSFLKEEGALVIKTDNEGLYEFTLEQAEAIHLKKTFDSKDYVFDEKSDAMSEYEKNFRSQGKNIFRLIYTR